MRSSRLLTVIAALAGLALIVVAVIYFVEPAHALPSFFPGHTAAHATEAGTHHVKHGVAALVVGFAGLVVAWFRSGPSAASAAS